MHNELRLFANNFVHHFVQLMLDFYPKCSIIYIEFLLYSLKEGRDQMKKMSFDDLSVLLGDPCMKELMSLSTDSVKFSITSIRACCDLIEQDPVTFSNKSKLYVNTINGECYRLMRTPSMYALLSTDNDEYFYDLGSRNFVGSFEKYCNEIIGDLCSFTSECSADAVFFTNEALLVYAILLFIRRSFLSSLEAPPEIKLSSYMKSRSKLVIELASSTDLLKRCTNIYYVPEFFEVYCSQFAEAAQNQLKCKIKAGRNSVTFTYDVDENEVDYIMHASSNPFKRLYFSPFRVMLSDLETFREQTLNWINNNSK